MTKKETQKVIADKLETFTLNKDTKEIWLLPYEVFGNQEPNCDIAETEKELIDLVKEHERFSDNYRIIKVSQGE